MIKLSIAQPYLLIQIFLLSKPEPIPALLKIIEVKGMNLDMTNKMSDNIHCHPESISVFFSACSLDHMLEDRMQILWTEKSRFKPRESGKHLKKGERE